MVIPEDGKRLKKSYLADEASKAASKAAADGAPPGFPTGAHTAAHSFLALCAHLYSKQQPDANTLYGVQALTTAGASL